MFYLIGKTNDGDIEMADGIMGYIDTSGAALAKKGTQDIVKTASKIYEALTGSYKILDKEIVITCPELIQKYSILLESTGGTVGKKIKFPFGKPVRVHLTPLRSLQEIPNAVTITETGFEISTKGFSNIDEFSLDVEYEIGNKRFVDALVRRDTAREIPKGKQSEYWLHAELKHPQVLKTKYGRLDLRDLDFNVDVGISEDIKMQIPPSFRVELEAARNLLRERDPHKKAVLGLKHAKSMKAREKNEDIVELLGNLQKLFNRDSFRKFVDVQKDFYYSDCYRGLAFHDSAPFPTWPKVMKVISRTDLGLEKFASEGILIYKKGNFLEEVSKILGL